MRRKQELLGVIWGFIGLFIVLCLLSYSPRDPCPFIREGITQPVNNWMGPVGAAIAGWLYALFGYASWLVALPPVVFSAIYFKGGKGFPWQNGKLRLAMRGAGAAAILVSGAVFLDLVFGRTEIDGEAMRAGGILGGVVSEALYGWLEWGAVALVFVFMVVALMAAVDFSPVRSTKALIGSFLWARDRIKDVIERRREAKRRHKEVAKEREEIEKHRTQPEIKIVLDQKQKQKQAPAKKPKQVKLPFVKEGRFELPGTDLLDEVNEEERNIDQESLLMNAKILENKLRDFGVQGEVVEVHPGPVITMYEYKPGPGVKINKITNLADDLALALSAVSVRIIAPIPGKDVVGIEISNADRETVSLREIIECDEFAGKKTPLPMALGKNITGDPFAFDLRKAPHLLVAGSTGAGKSVSLNAMIMSVLYRSTPKEAQMLMIDPKRLELSIYEGIPHLLHPVIADPKKASMALKWAVAEMESRYRLLAAHGVRNIDSFNRLIIKENSKEKKSKKEEASVEDHMGDTVPISPEESAALSESEKMADEKPPLPGEPLPLILIIIDELADLMMVAAKDIEASICRLAQMARAAGMHLILATQRPSVDVITGLIKANFPSRVAFKVASKTDSRTILDQNGAERLLGQGDMLFIPPGTSSLTRLHGAYVSDDEIKRAVEFWSSQGEPEYDEEIVKPQAEEAEEVDVSDVDDKYEAALQIVVQTRQASVSMLQRKLKIGYNRAARIIDQMETEGIVGPSDGVKPREVLIDPLQLEQRAG